MPARGDQHVVLEDLQVGLVAPAAPAATPPPRSLPPRSLRSRPRRRRLRRLPPWSSSRFVLVVAGPVLATTGPACLFALLVLAVVPVLPAGPGSGRRSPRSSRLLGLAPVLLPCALALALVTGGIGLLSPCCPLSRCGRWPLLGAGLVAQRPGPLPCRALRLGAAGVGAPAAGGRGGTPAGAPASGWSRRLAAAAGRPDCAALIAATSSALLHAAEALDAQTTRQLLELGQQHAAQSRRPALGGGGFGCFRHVRSFPRPGRSRCAPAASFSVVPGSGSGPVDMWLPRRGQTS